MIDYSEAGKRFASQAELLGCFAEILDLHIYYHYKYHFWVSPDSNIQSMLGVVVTREEFEKNLLKTSDSRIFPGLTDEEREEIAMMRNFFFGRVMATPESCGFPVFNMEVAFGKDRFEFLTMLTLLCCEINRRYEKLFAYLQDDISKKRPTADTMIRLWGEPGSLVSGYYRYFSAQNTLMKYICEPSAGSLCTMQLKLSEPVVGFLTGGGADHEFFRATDD